MDGSIVIERDTPTFAAYDGIKYHYIYTMIEQQQEACRVLIFQNVCPNVLRRMISLARDESIAYWKRHMHHITEAELEMLYTHLSNGLMHVVVEGYEKYSREEVVRFVNRIVQCSLSQFQ